MENLTDEQKELIKSWVENGADLNEIQSRIQEEFAVCLTFLDTRFLVSDLGVVLKPTKEQENEQESDRVPADSSLLGGESMGGGRVQVSVNQTQQPGTIASGRVTFSDGKMGNWYFDQMGRLGLDPDEAGYRPSEKDILDFQEELQNVAAKLGMV